MKIAVYHVLAEKNLVKGSGQSHKTPDRVVSTDFSARAKRRKAKRLVKVKKTAKTNKRGFV